MEDKSEGLKQELQLLETLSGSIEPILTKRYNSIELIGKWWDSKDFGSCARALCMMKDQTVTRDILKEWKSFVGLSLDEVALLLEPVAQLIKSKYSQHITVGIHSACRILRDHAHLIKRTGSTPGARACLEIYGEIQYLISGFIKRKDKVIYISDGPASTFFI